MCEEKNVFMLNYYEHKCYTFKRWFQVYLLRRKFNATHIHHKKKIKGKWISKESRIEIYLDNIYKNIKRIWKKTYNIKINPKNKLDLMIFQDTVLPLLYDIIVHEEIHRALKDITNTLGEEWAIKKMGY